MIKVLITGAESYIGLALERYLTREPEAYTVDTVDMIGDSWKQKDFSGYDAVFHVAGIVHKKEKQDMRDLYFKVNCDLAYETAQKAKSEGVKHFIFLSSMSVYGIENGIIDIGTIPNPISFYGQSKLKAEKSIKSLESDTFKVATLRPPMVYGKSCRGNYPRLAKIALKSPVFPDINNRRSMIYIENLTGFVKLLIDECDDGLFFPQNTNYVKTSELVELIAGLHGRKIRVTKIFNPFIKLLNFGIINKVFGDLVYEKEMSAYKHNYNSRSFKESVELTEM
jgi:nucleoside-diphosphate-sugar epimerase